MGIKVGYARVSTPTQDVGMQVDALVRDGCRHDDIFYDRASGAVQSIQSRDGLKAALARVKPGDTLVVWKLDRLGRSLQHLVETVHELGDRGVGFRSITEAIDTTNGAGKFMFHLFAALAEFERSLISERTMAGIALAKAQGRHGGRRPALSAEQTEQARKMIEDGMSVAATARVLRVHRASIYRAFNRQGER